MMEKKESKRPAVYYLREVENEKGELELLVEDTPETGEVYISKEIVDQNGNLHVIFWKKSNKTRFV